MAILLPASDYQLTVRWATCATDCTGYTALRLGPRPRYERTAAATTVPGVSCSIGVTGRRSDLLCVQHICDKAGGRAWWAAALESPHPHVSTGNSGGALSARGWKGERRHALDLLLAADEHESFMNRRLGTTKRYCPSSAITLRRHCVRYAGFSPSIVYRVPFPPCVPGTAARAATHSPPFWMGCSREWAQRGYPAWWWPSRCLLG
jgi:hypothetical protein